MINVTKTSLPDLKDYLKYLKKIWRTAWLTNDGILVRTVEAKLKKYLKVKHLVLVANGTLALQLILKALAVDGEVVTTPFTFPATTNVIVWAGLKPVFADIDPATFNIDQRDVAKKITAATRAILAVHVYGNPCDVAALQKIADQHRLKLIYDAAHCFGVEYKNQSVLNFGDASILSFHATKTFHTIEGGAIVVPSKKLEEKLKFLRDFGIGQADEAVVLPGINPKMNEFQAAMGLCNLKNINQEIGLRKKIWEKYRRELGACPVIKFPRLSVSKYNYTYLPVCFENRKKRDQIYATLAKQGIKARKYFFPLTVHSRYLQKRGVNLLKKYNLKVASRVADGILCLPLYPQLAMSVVDKIIKIVKQNL